MDQVVTYNRLLETKSQHSSIDQHNIIGVNYVNIIYYYTHIITH